MTAADISAPPGPLRWSVNAALFGGCITRTYCPDPDHNVPLTLTALPARTIGTTG